VEATFALNFCTNAPDMHLVDKAARGDHPAMDIDKSAWITIERALARFPLVRRRKVLKMLKATSAPWPRV
jgi:hypothetical protein